MHASIIHRATTILIGLFPAGASYGQGSPANVITDDSAAEKDGFRRVWPNFISYRVCGNGYSILIIIKMKGNT